MNRSNVLVLALVVSGCSGEGSNSPASGAEQAQSVGAMTKPRSEVVLPLGEQGQLTMTGVEPLSGRDKAVQWKVPGKVQLTAAVAAPDKKFPAYAIRIVSTSGGKEVELGSSVANGVVEGDRLTCTADLPMFNARSKPQDCRVVLTGVGGDGSETLAESSVSIQFIE